MQLLWRDPALHITVLVEGTKPSEITILLTVHVMNFTFLLKDTRTYFA